MSWDMWHVEGYGINTDPSVVSEEKMVSFIKNHMDTIRNGWETGYEDLEKLIEEIDKIGIDNVDFEVADEIRECTDMYCYGEIIAGVIGYETGYSIQCTGISDDGEEAVVFFPTYPWSYPDNERNLTQKELDDIFVRYGKELFDRETQVEYIDFTFSG